MALLCSTHQHYDKADVENAQAAQADSEKHIQKLLLLGLYRYRLGDVVKVMGFHNATPKLKFVCCQSLLLSVNIDKNTKKDLTKKDVQLAVEEASMLQVAEKVNLIDFTSHVNVSKDPGDYVIFWE